VLASVPALLKELDEHKKMNAMLILRVHSAEAAGMDGGGGGGGRGGSGGGGFGGGGWIS
jgi:uncharacterized membrane protein